MLIERDLVITKFSLSFYDNKIHLNEFSFFFAPVIENITIGGLSEIALKKL
jgi:hypothetical protein